MFAIGKARTSGGTRRYVSLGIFVRWSTILLVGVWLVSGIHPVEAAEKILFENNFSGIGSTWKVWDDPSAKNGPSNWVMGLVELSGINNRQNKVASALIAGEPHWCDYRIETTLFTLGWESKHYFSLLFGYQDPLHFYQIGYDMSAGRFELDARTEDRFETIAACHVRKKSGVVIPVQLVFSSGRIRFMADDTVIFDVIDTRYRQGQFGVGAAGMGKAHASIGPITVTALDPGALPEPGEQDILAAKDATIAPGTDEKFSRLIDHVILLQGVSGPVTHETRQTFDERTQAAEAVFKLPGQAGGEIHRIDLKGVSTDLPVSLDLMVSSTNKEADFRQIGRLALQSGGDADRTVLLEPTRAKYLKLRLSSKAAKGKLDLSEIFVFGLAIGKEDAAGPVVEPTPKIKPGSVLFRDDFTSGSLNQWTQWDDPTTGQNLGHWAMGLSEFSGIGTSSHRSSATMLITGEADWTNYAFAVDLFAAGPDGLLTALVFGHQDAQHYYHTGYDEYSERWILGIRTPAGFQLLAEKAAKFQYKQWIQLKVYFVEGQILVTADDRILFAIEDSRYTQGRIGIDTSSLGDGNLIVRKARVASITPSDLPSGIGIVGNLDARLPKFEWSISDEQTGKQVGGMQDQWGYEGVPAGVYKVTLTIEDVTTILKTTAVAEHGLTTLYAANDFGLDKILIAASLKQNTTTTNLVSSSLGGRVDSLGSQFDTRKFAAVNLIDGRIGEGHTWRSSDSSLPQELAFSFIDGLDAMIEEIILDTTSSKGAVRPQDIEIEVSKQGDEFAKIGSFRLKDQDGRQTLQFEPVRAQKVKLRIVSMFPYKGSAFTYRGSNRPVEMTEVIVKESTAKNIPSLAERYLPAGVTPLPESKPGAIFSSLFYTLDDIIIFSYFGNTKLEIVKPGGELIKQTVLDTGETLFEKVGQGVFSVRATKPFALLIGDPISKSVMGYHALGVDGHPLGREFYTYQPKDVPDTTRGQWVGEALKVFAYADSTRVSVFDAKSGGLLALATLRQGGLLHLPISSRYVRVLASKPVSVLSYADVGFAVPAKSGIFRGKEFYTYAGEITEGYNIVNILAPEKNAQVAIRDALSDEMISVHEVKAGKLMRIPLKDRHIQILAGDNVFVWQSESIAWNAHQLFPAIGENGRGIDRNHFVIATGDTIVLAYENTDGVLYNLATGRAVQEFHLAAGQSKVFGPVRDAKDEAVALQIKNTGKVSVLVSVMGAYGASFVPLSFHDTGLSVKIKTPDKMQTIAGETDIAADVFTSPFYPVKTVEFYVDDQHVGTAMEEPFEIRFDVGPPGRSHQIRVVANNTADQTASDSLETRARLGNGMLAVTMTEETFAQWMRPRIEMILDASGSMREKKRRIDGRLKIAVAKDVMRELIEGLPEGIEVAFRVYGRRVREGQKGDCQDSELLVPFGRLDKPRLQREVAGISALGTTPLSYSLLKAGEDIAGQPGEKIIILVTDGKEECGMDPADAARSLVEQGLNVRVNVVGFALAEEKIKADMRRVAAITGGRFFDAQDRGELLTSIRSAMTIPYEVFDESGERAATATTGGAMITLREGLYTVKMSAAEKAFEIPTVSVAEGRYTIVELHQKGKDLKPHILGPYSGAEAERAKLSGPPSLQSVIISQNIAFGAEFTETQHGLRLQTVLPGGLAEKAQLKADDVITHLDGHQLQGEDELHRVLKQVRTGKKTKSLLIVRRVFKEIALEIRRAVVPSSTGYDQRVRQAQHWLSQIGFTPGPTDGYWGQKTMTAIRKFQAWYPREPLAVTGKLDDKTYRAIREAVRRGMKKAD